MRAAVLVRSSALKRRERDGAGRRAIDRECLEAGDQDRRGVRVRADSGLTPCFPAMISAQCRQMARNRDDPNTDAEREPLLNEIITDDLEFRLRERLSEDRIEHFAEILDELPPVEVFDVRGKLYLVDGFHRHAAARKAGRSSLRASVRGGTREEAIERALTANTASSLSLTQSERWHAAVRLKRLRPKSSNRRIARDVGVSEGTVRNIAQYMKLNTLVSAEVLDRLTVRKRAALTKAKPDHRGELAEAAVYGNWSSEEIRERADSLRDATLGPDRLELIRRSNENAAEREKQQSRWERDYAEAARFAQLLARLGEIEHPASRIAVELQRHPHLQNEDLFRRGWELVIGFIEAGQQQGWDDQ